MHQQALSNSAYSYKLKYDENTETLQRETEKEISSITTHLLAKQ